MSGVNHPRGTSNSSMRGSAANRRSRKSWLVVTFGDGTHVACWRAHTHCGQYRLTVETVQADRILPGALGGTYRRINLRPSCSGCNITTGNELREAMRRGDIIEFVRWPEEAAA